MEELMLRIDNVSKMYKLGQIGGTTLRDEHGREDPTKKIGARDYNKGEIFMALDGVSFEVGKGERVGIIGHNGAGKSTLLKLISRVTAPTGGYIGLNGRVASMLEVGTGFHGELTGRENIYMNGAILGMTKKEIDAKVEDIIEFSECRQFIDTPVKRYSSGMYVKLAFSVAAHLESEIMIMDEVLAVGDMAFQKKCLEKMSDVSKTEGRTILYVSHNMNTIRELCDRVVVLDHGKVIFDGGVEDGITEYLGVNCETKTKYVYSKERNGVPIGERATVITGIDVFDRDVNVLERGEPLCFILHCKTNKKCVDFRIRFEIRLNDKVIGTAFTDKAITAEAGAILDIECEFDTSVFPPGVYCADALLYFLGEYGRQDWSDKVSGAMFFEIIPNRDDRIVWLSNYWGHVYYHDIIIHNVNISEADESRDNGSI